MNKLLQYYKSKFGDIEPHEIITQLGKIKRADKEWIELNLFYDLRNSGSDGITLYRCIMEVIISYVFSNSRKAMEERFLKLQEILLENKIDEFYAPVHSFKTLTRLDSILVILSDYGWELCEIKNKNIFKFKKNV